MFIIMKATWNLWRTWIFLFWFLGSTQSAHSAKLVELFTSQGCSMCAPADIFIANLEKQYDVVVISYHIDYWDYLGWADDLAIPESTFRQIDYQRASGSKQLFTPQIVIDGQISVPGNDIDTLTNALNILDSPVEIDAGIFESSEFKYLEIKKTNFIESLIDVMLIEISPYEQREILEGENKGKLLSYVNSAKSIELLDQWDGSQNFKQALSLKAGGEYVLILQEPDAGSVIFAKYLSLS